MDFSGVEKENDINEVLFESALKRYSVRCRGDHSFIIETESQTKNLGSRTSFTRIF